MVKLDWYGLKVTPWDDVIDGRKILDRIEEIEGDQVTDEGEEIPDDEWPEDVRTERRVLAELVEAIGEQACRDGVTLIRESHFRDYIEEFYADCGSEYHEERGHPHYDMRRVPWDELMSRAPFKFIDWDAVADDEQSDYQETTFEGTTYYYLEP